MRDIRSTDPIVGEGRDWRKGSKTIKAELILVAMVTPSNHHLQWNTAPCHRRYGVQGQSNIACRCHGWSLIVIFTFVDLVLSLDPKL